MCGRYAGKPGWPKTFTTPTLFPERIEKAARWPDLTGTKRPGKPWLDGRPRMIFLNDLGDLFAPFDPCPPDFYPRSRWLNVYLPTIARSPHVWLLLTKWPDRLAEFAKWRGGLPRNLWCGTTVTDQRTADERIPWLLDCPATVRWISREPSLGLVQYKPEWLKKIHLIAHGGESGPGARPDHPDWARADRDQCQAAGVKYFFKSWGAWASYEQLPSTQGSCCRGWNWTRDKDGFRYGTITTGLGKDETVLYGGRDFQTLFLPNKDSECAGSTVVKVGKKAAGRLLDGKEWNEMPENELGG
jgi:protein gp37